MKFIIGKKSEMSQKFNEDGTVVPVTTIKAGPCSVTQVRKEEKDGYKAVQIGYDLKKKTNKPSGGHLKDLENFRHLREFRADDADQYERGQRIDVSVFNVGEKVMISGKSKGKGFQGVVKRHGFHGSPASHGHKDQLRMPGSIGSTEPARVFKGTRMGGRMGGKGSTAKNLEIIAIDKENNTLVVRGPVPGARNSLVMVETIR